MKWSVGSDCLQIITSVHTTASTKYGKKIRNVCYVINLTWSWLADRSQEKLREDKDLEKKLYRGK